MGNTLVGNQIGVDLHFYVPDNLFVGKGIGIALHALIIMESLISIRE